jgi:hypothetical protein
LSLTSEDVLAIRALIYLNWGNGWPMIDQSAPPDVDDGYSVLTLGNGLEMLRRIVGYLRAVGR